jgi:DNA-directed RNA polymerase specialized sigma subunit
VHETKPESIYRTATTKPERRRVQAAVVDEYRSLVDGFVRRTVPAQHLEEATECGCIALLIALEKYDPATAGEFRFFAFGYVRDEVQKWLAAGKGGAVVRG